MDIELMMGSGTGPYQVKLWAFSKNGDKKDMDTKTLNIESGMAKVTFWQAPSCGCSETFVEINNVYRTITSDNNQSPGCNSNGSANFEFLPGFYTYYATDWNKEWTGSINLQGGCTTFQLK
ncbi:MAG: hypothetical protein H0X62_11175 [Bacteroidetes bacterium]|nr:hypothetical protein [Bacteroidota bacterium]